MSQTAYAKTIQLTPRDMEIILAVYHYDGLFSYQVRRRFWGENGHPRSFNRRLAELINQEYLRARPMDSATGRGSGDRLITIGAASHQLLKRKKGLEQSEIRQLRHSIVPSDWRHDADVRDFGLSVELAARSHPQVEELEWENEAVFKRKPLNVVVADPDNLERQLTVPLIPDWSFSLKTNFQQLPKIHYLEVDEDTESRTKLLHRIGAYLQLVGNRQIPVLWLVPSRSRAEKLSGWMQGVADALHARASIFAIAIRDQVDERRVLTGPIWQVVGHQGFASLLPIRNEVSANSWLEPLSAEGMAQQ